MGNSFLALRSCASNAPENHHPPAWLSARWQTSVVRVRPLVIGDILFFAETLCVKRCEKNISYHCGLNICLYRIYIEMLSKAFHLRGRWARSARMRWESRQWSQQIIPFGSVWQACLSGRKVLSADGLLNRYCVRAQNFQNLLKCHLLWCMIGV